MDLGALLGYPDMQMPLEDSPVCIETHSQSGRCWREEEQDKQPPAA